MVCGVVLLLRLQEGVMPSPASMGLIESQLARGPGTPQDTVSASQSQCISDRVCNSLRKSRAVVAGALWNMA